MTRIVYDPDGTMGYKYRGRVVEDRTWRGKPRFRGVIDRHFMGWTEHHRSVKVKTFEEAEAWCQAWLDAMEHKHDGAHVEERS